MCIRDRYRGLAQVTNWVKLKFAAMNLKKLARWRWKEQFSHFLIALFWPYMLKTRFVLDAQTGFFDKLTAVGVKRLRLFF